MGEAIQILSVAKTRQEEGKFKERVETGSYQEIKVRVAVVDDYYTEPSS